MLLKIIKGGLVNIKPPVGLKCVLRKSDKPVPLGANILPERNDSSLQLTY